MFSHLYYCSNVFFLHLFIKGALICCKLTVKTCIMIQKIYVISNKCYSVELTLSKNPEKTCITISKKNSTTVFLTFRIKRNVS